MYIHRESNKQIGIAFIQAVSIKFIPDRLLFSPTIICWYIEESNIRDIDIEADSVQFK